MQAQIGLHEALNTFYVSGIAGAVGGFVGGINAAASNSIRLMRIGNGPRPPLHVDLGFVGDILVGGAAGIAIVLFVSVLTSQPSGTPPELFRLIPISLMSGIVSKRALAGMADAVVKKIAHLEEGQVRMAERASASDLVQEGEDYLKQGVAEKADQIKRVGKYESAKDKFLKALSIDPNHPVANVNLGKALKRLAMETDDRELRSRLLHEAVDAVSRTINSYPENERAYYNRACYKAVLGSDVLEVVADLGKAIQLFSQNRSFAESDNDFDAIRGDARFRSLVYGAEAAHTA